MEIFIRVDFSESSEGGTVVNDHECIPATETDKARFRVQKPPIFADAPNVFDEIEACAAQDSPTLVFQRIFKPSKYHLIRVAPDVKSKENLEATTETLRILEEIGCVLAHNEQRAAISIAIPPDGVLAAKLVLSAEIESIWECKPTDRVRIVAFLKEHDAIEHPEGE